MIEVRVLKEAALISCVGKKEISTYLTHITQILLISYKMNENLRQRYCPSALQYQLVLL